MTAILASIPSSIILIFAIFQSVMLLILCYLTWNHKRLLREGAELFGEEFASQYPIRPQQPYIIAITALTAVAAWSWLILK